MWDDFDFDFVPLRADSNSSHIDLKLRYRGLLDDWDDELTPIPADLNLQTPTCKGPRLQLMCGDIFCVFTADPVAMPLPSRILLEARVLLKDVMQSAAMAEKKE